MTTQNTYHFTCKYCNKLANIDFNTEDYHSVFNSDLDIADMNNVETEIYLATFSLHQDCFAEILEQYKNDDENKIQAGFYVSQNTFDDDEHREVPVFSYIHKNLPYNRFEVWSINTSSRYVRKGGEFLSKSVVSFEMLVLHLNNSLEKRTDEPRESLINVLETYAKGVRKEFLQSIVEATTEAIIEDPLSTYSENILIDDYREFLDDCDIFHKNLFLI